MSTAGLPSLTGAPAASLGAAYVMVPNPRGESLQPDPQANSANPATRPTHPVNISEVYRGAGALSHRRRGAHNRAP